MSVLYPLSEIDTYCINTFCTAETFSCVYTIYTADILAGVLVTRWSTLNPVSTGMGDCLRVGKLSHYVTSHPGQLSLAIPPWVGAMSSGNGYDSVG